MAKNKDKTTERTQFCWNCFHLEKAQYEKPCVTCFGITNTGQFFNYRNWELGIDSTVPNKIK